MDKRPDGHLDGDRLCDYAEGLLDPGARASADAHLRGCDVCRRELQALRGYFSDLASLEPEPAPADFLAKVHARLPRPSPWKAFLGSLWLFPRRHVPAQVFGLAILGVTGLLLYRLRDRVAERPVVTALPAPRTPPAASAPAAAPSVNALAAVPPESAASEGNIAVTEEAKPKAARTRPPSAPAAVPALPAEASEPLGEVSRRSPPPARKKSRSEPAEELQADRADAYAARDEASASGGAAVASAPAPAPTVPPPAAERAAPSAKAAAGSAGTGASLGNVEVTWTLSLGAAGPDGSAFAAALAKTGARVAIRGADYDLRLPAGKQAALEALLRGEGSLDRPSAPLPAAPDGTVHIRLRVIPP